MPRADNAGVSIEYDTLGDPADPPLLLIMGLRAQMTAWEDGFRQLLADRGIHVIRFDNRDCGLSSKTAGAIPNVMALFGASAAGRPVTADVPYTLSEMAADGLAVLDDLGVGRANIAGASMGGMVAQQLAIEHPERVSSLCSIMSTTGARDVGQSTPEAMSALFAPPPADRAGVIERAVDIGRVLCGPLFDEGRAVERAAAAYDRSFNPEGVAFQLAAILASGDRTAGLQELDVPTLVIHGKADPLVQPSGGEATAAAVPGAELVLLDEMGHDLPRPLWPAITSAIAEHVLAAA
jgi:pimeloyl-ACP methyl ester carboxylesterase